MTAVLVVVVHVQHASGNVKALVLELVRLDALVVAKITVMMVARVAIHLAEICVPEHAMVNVMADATVQPMVVVHIAHHVQVDARVLAVLIVTSVVYRTRIGVQIIRLCQYLLITRMAKRQNQRDLQLVS